MFMKALESHVERKRKMNIEKISLSSRSSYGSEACYSLKTSTSLQCPLCHHSDSALHILSDCQHQTFSGMIFEHHNIACRHH